LGMLPYFPLASGMLSGKYRRGEAPPDGTRFANLAMLAERELQDGRFDKVEKLTAYAEERGHTILELAFAGLLAQPAVSSVIAGATKPEQVKANAAAGAWRLTAEEASEVSALV